MTPAFILSAPYQPFSQAAVLKAVQAIQDADTYLLGQRARESSSSAMACHRDALAALRKILPIAKVL